jgi:hypothetical protein
MSRHVVAVRSAPSRRTVTAAAVLGALALAACGSTPVSLSAKKSPTPKPATPTAAATATLTPTPAPPPPPPVAGATYTAPAMVQIENLNAARPQSGLQSANVVYEYSAEGGISRFTAIYFSTPAGQVGPLRSARLISPVLVNIWGGTLIYSGSSVYVNNRLVNQHIPRFDETSAGGDMYRISSRYAPHNLYTSGSRVDDMVHRSKRAAVTYQLWSRATSAPTGGAPRSSVTVPVSPSERPTWTWNAGLAGWTRTEPDTGTFIEANTGKPLVAGTVIVMQVPARINPADIENGCCTAGWEYTMTGSGPMQVFTGGAEYDGTWSQGASGPPQFTMIAGGAAPIAPGLVVIEVVPSGQRAPAH